MQVKRHQVTVQRTTGTEVPLDLSKIPIGGGGPVGGPGVNTYYGLTGGNAGSTTIDLYSAAMPVAGVIKQLTFQCDIPPGLGNTITATLYVNGVATLLSVQITGASSTFGVDAVNTVAFTATDELTMQVNNGILSACTRSNWGMLILIP